jgi:cysteine/O-acetylserine efflux protein
MARKNIMETDLVALASFVIVTTFTPGPNNITSASMGILYGYRKTWYYLAGIMAGFFLMMLICGLVSTTLLEVFPRIEVILRVAGAAYILWLAYHTLKASYVFDEEGQPLMGFSKGFLLQLLNPKVIVYGLTLYATFLGGKVTNPLVLVLSAAAFAGVGFAAVSTWTAFGAAIRRYLDQPRVKTILNTALSLLLVYTAVELSGLLDWLTL